MRSARAPMIWAALAVAIGVPIALAAASEQIAWRGPLYILAGFAGIIALGEGRGEAWALLAQDAGRLMPAIVRALARGLAISPFRRVQIVTACDFPPARRLARLLGFSFEGRLRAYLSDGGDAELWART